MPCRGKPLDDRSDTLLPTQLGVHVKQARNSLTNTIDSGGEAIPSGT